MPSAHTQVRQAIDVVVPGLSFPKKLVLSGAEIIRFGLLVGRKVRVWNKKENIIPLALGTMFNASFGDRPSVQKIAQLVFGSLSIIRCGEDLIQIIHLAIKAVRCFQGREYVVVRKDTWPSATPKAYKLFLIQEHWRWMRYFYYEQVKLAFISIVQIFKQLAQLALHLSDAYSAFTEQHVPEVFVYAKDLWKALTSENAILVKELKNTNAVTNLMLAKMGSTWTSDFLLSLLMVPARINEKLPDIRDVHASVRNSFENTVIRIDAVGEELKARYSQFLDNTTGILNVPSIFVPNLQGGYLIFGAGSSSDPDMMRFIPPPKKCCGLGCGFVY